MIRWWLVGLVGLVLAAGCTQTKPQQLEHDGEPIVNCVTSSPSSPCISGVQGDVAVALGTADNSLTQDIQGRVLAACVPGITTEAELIAWLRGAASRRDGTVGMIGYVGANGDAHALSEAMLRGQP